MSAVAYLIGQDNGGRKSEASKMNVDIAEVGNVANRLKERLLKSEDEKWSS